ncbi:mitotic spindle checkpoint protein Bub3 [Lobulomyces angularis]|nr:mitotic spindle checkpoint protein Bub3 [Lobulomyces angularis]
MAASNEFELVDPPSDGISSVKFSPSDPALLLCTSWDKSLRLYDVKNNSVKFVLNSKNPILNCCFDKLDVNKGYYAGVSRKLVSVDLITGLTTDYGSPHTQPIRCLESSKETGTIFTGSWDKSIKQFDPRTSNDAIGEYAQPGKIFALDVSHHKLVFAMAGRAVYIYDIRNMKEPYQKRESTLKFMTRTVKCMPNGEGYVSSSIEGRVAVEFFDPSEEVQAKKYAFKCHRQTVDTKEIVYPVNAVAFHPVHGTFCTGGSDGVVGIWDGFNKKRLKFLPAYPAGISSLDFSCTGDILAIASSYTYEEGEKDHAPDSIFIRPIVESEVLPKHIKKT